MVRSKTKKKKKRADKTADPEDRNILIRDANIWTGRGFIRGSILVQQGRIKRIARRIDDGSIESINASGLYALPGLVDVHVHLRDMKLAYKEDFATGTSAAAAGGFTTVLDMPNTAPPTDSPKRLIEKQERAIKRTHVNVGFHAAAVRDPRTITGIVRAGAFSLKLYLPKPFAPLDVSDDEEIRKLMEAAGREKIPVTLHAEDLSSAKESFAARDFGQLARNRLPLFETRAVDRMLRIQEGTGCRLHCCHITLPSSLERIASKSAEITSEVTPHHLLLSRRLMSRLGWKGWMVPPLRSEASRRGLLAATVSGQADVVASDHAPHVLEEKARAPGKSLPGIPGLETTLPLMLTLVDRGILTMSLLVRLLAENPAKTFVLKNKGKLDKGRDGDLVLIDLKKRSQIDSTKFFSKAKFSPFDGFKTRGAVHSTIVGGRLVYNEGDIVGREGCGSLLRSRFPS